MMGNIQERACQGEISFLPYYMIDNLLTVALMSSILKFLEQLKYLNQFFNNEMKIEII